MINVQSQAELAWSSGFLKQFNRVCKYEKEQEDAERDAHSPAPREESKLASAEMTDNRLSCTRTLEPLVRYTV